MLYISTRGKCEPMTGAKAIVTGIAPDGGLMIPQEIPEISAEDINLLNPLSYPERAAFILGKFLPDWQRDFLVESCKSAYNTDKFDAIDVAPLVNLKDNLSVLELWHGPTCAFKDMALQMLPYLMAQGVRMTGDDTEIVILVATSGDTGKAALEGFKDVPGTKIIVFYPADGVSQVQRLQMVTQEGGNVAVVAVEGNFDDAQTGVKEIFGNKELSLKMAKKGLKFSSANSINWGRLVPQVVYYVVSYLELVNGGRIKANEEVNFVVPTGNFGNILAAYYAFRLGVPIKRLICASNENNVLTDFIRTGIYDRNRNLHQTISPSMDILVSSNLERLLFEVTGRDHNRVYNWMKDLKEKGRYEVDRETLGKIQELFYSDFVTDEEAIDNIRTTYDRHGYLIDPHTAVGMTVCERYQESVDPNTNTVVVSTASPFKFNGSVAQALLGLEAVKGKDEFQLLGMVSELSGIEVPAGLRDLNKKEIRHRIVSSRSGMEDKVISLLELEYDNK